MQSTTTSVDDYMETVPPERREGLTRLRRMCLDLLDGYKEEMLYGMPAYTKDGASGVAWNSQKNYISLYLNPELLDRYREELKDCGKSCVRFSNPNRIDFALVEKLIKATAEWSVVATS